MERHWSEAWKHRAKDAFQQGSAPQAEPTMTEARTESRPQAATGSDMIRQHGNRPYPKPSWAPRVDNTLYFKALNAERAKEREKLRTWRRETRAGRDWTPGGREEVSSREASRSFADAAKGPDATPSGEAHEPSNVNRAAARDGWRDTYANDKTRARGRGRSR